MTCQVVRATKEHIISAQEWVRRRGMTAPPLDMFSGLGFVVPGVAAWWLYLTDSSIAYTGFLVGNPDVSKSLRDEGLDAIIDALILEAKSAQCRTIVVSVKMPVVKSRLKKHGFIVAEEGYSFMGLALGNPEGMV